MDFRETEMFIDETIHKLNETLKKFCNKDEGGRKKAELVAYWLKDYSKYLEFEERFTPLKLKEYERGDIIKVNFGFNIGNEEGGLHYAVVVDNKNAQASGVITVIPLSSYKIGEELSKFDVSLGNELYILVKNKFDLVIKMYDETYSKLEKTLDELTIENELIERMKKEINTIESDASIELKKLVDKKKQTMSAKLEEVRKEMSDNKWKLSYAKRVLKEFKRMNSGSKALVGQITTVSKIRIYDPKHSQDVLAGIKLSPNMLDRINEKIKELYIYNVDKDEINEYNEVVKENNAV